MLRKNHDGRFPSKLSPIKWFLGAIVFLVVTIGCAALGIWMSGGPREGTPAAVSPALAIALVIFGVVVASIGLVVYAIVLLTNLFTFDFTRPFFGSFGGKLWVANLIVGLLLQTGFALVMSPTIMAVLGPVLPASFIWIAAFFLPFILAQVLLVWLTIWAPLETGVIAKRLNAKGIGPELLARGHYVGLSDPAKSSLKKMTLVEEDLGMLWVEPHALMYRGDRVDWDFSREQVLEVQRQADAGSTSSYFGAVHVVLRVADATSPSGERRIRLHPEGDWTMTAKARTLNALADRLQSWKVSTSAAPGAFRSRPASANEYNAWGA
jgi:hypothetical protein